MIKALIQYWVVRKKPHACFKVFQKAAKCHTRLDVEGIELILEAARLTEEPCQLTVGSVVPYLEAIQSNGTNARDPTEPSSKKLNLDLEWIEVIKFLSETGFPNPNNYGDGVTDEQITLAKASAQRILDISKNVSQLPSSINQIVFYAKGALQLTPGKTRAEDRKFLLESFMHGWMDTRGDINEMEKAVLVVEAV